MTSTQHMIDTHDEENYKCECKPSELCGKCIFDKYNKPGFGITTKNKLIDNEERFN